MPYAGAAIRPGDRRRPPPSVGRGLRLITEQTGGFLRPSPEPADRNVLSSTQGLPEGDETDVRVRAAPEHEGPQMSPVIGLGPRCAHCHKRPVWTDALCSPCWRMAAACGRRPGDLALSQDHPEPASEILDSDSVELERCVAAWLAGTDPSPSDVPWPGDESVRRSRGTGSDLMDHRSGTTSL